MKKWFYLLLSVCSCSYAEVQTAQYVNLERYMGKWYEIALLPNRFEKKCVEGAIAEYSLREDGTVKVINTCQTVKGLSKATGIAWVVDSKSHAKLKVSFVPVAKYFKWFGGDYWILYIDPDYQFAVVGSPNCKYLWLLARKPKVSDATYQKFLNVAAENGFNTANIERKR